MTLLTHTSVEFSDRVMLFDLGLSVFECDRPRNALGIPRIAKEKQLERRVSLFECDRILENPQEKKIDHLFHFGYLSAVGQKKNAEPSTRDSRRRSLAAERREDDRADHQDANFLRGKRASFTRGILIR